MKFTTSWDDGYADDLRLAAVLDRHAMKGTFYVCPVAQHGQTMLTPNQIRELSTRHEIGAHSVTHPKLTKIPLEDARRELCDSRKWVESITGKQCTMFCYPYGDHNEAIASLAQEEKFLGARTVESYAFEGGNPYMLGTSIHLYPFPLRPVMDRRAFRPVKDALPVARRLGISTCALRGWLPFAKALFQAALRKNAPWFHLWGHSAEVTKFGMWSHLESFLDYVGTMPNIEHVPNSSLVPQ